MQFYVSYDKRELDRTCIGFSDAYKYAKELRDAHGLDVPNHAIEALKADAIEEAVSIFGPDSAVAELKAENDKLRELFEGFADSFEKDAAMNNGNGPYYSGEDWLSLANDMRIELANI